MSYKSGQGGADSQALIWARPFTVYKRLHIHPLRKVVILLLQMRIIGPREIESLVIHHWRVNQTKITLQTRPLIPSSKLFLPYPHWLWDYYWAGPLENWGLKGEWKSDRFFSKLTCMSHGLESSWDVAPGHSHLNAWEPPNINTTKYC